MSVSTKDFLKQKELPTFIVKGLKPFDKIHKVFPSIGLSNCEEASKIDTVLPHSTGHLLKSAIVNELDRCYGLICATDAFFEEGKLIQATADAIHYSYPVEENNKIVLKLYKDIIDADGKRVFSQNASIFKVYNKLYNLISDLKSESIQPKKLEDLEHFKQFSSENIPQHLKIVFSSDGVDGLWDISTISMRGITSCQSWEGQYKKKLIGTIVDPFAAVIYLTSGSNTKYGSKMVRRCIVRFIVDKDKKPFILLDRMYSNYDEGTAKEFNTFIKNKTDNKFDVIDIATTVEDIKSYYIPTNSSIHGKLKQSQLSYRDSKIPYKFERKLEKSVIEKNINSKNTRFKNILTKSIFNVKDYPKLKNEDVNYILESPDFKHIVYAFYKQLSDEIIELCSKDIHSSSLYMRQLCYLYMREKAFINTRIKKHLLKDINSYYKTKIKFKSIRSMLIPVQNIIADKIKQELKKTLSKDIDPIPLPS